MEIILAEHDRRALQESAGRIPSTRTLQRYARATGHKLRIKLVPAG